jgi:hypothetical protein
MKIPSPANSGITMLLEQEKQVSSPHNTLTYLRQSCIAARKMRLPELKQIKSQTLLSILGVLPASLSRLGTPNFLYKRSSSLFTRADISSVLPFSPDHLPGPVDPLHQAFSEWTQYYPVLYSIRRHFGPELGCFRIVAESPGWT